jgi:histidine triad (HIT) family protein
MSDCLFCRIARGEIPAALVGESELCLAFRDIAPQAPVHVLVIPRAHYRSLSETPDATVLGAMGELAKQVARELGIAESGYRVVLNTGEHGGQTVHHIHMHLLGGRHLKWPPG